MSLYMARFAILLKCKRIGECLLWQNATAGAGYGTITYEGVQHYTHRLMYESVHGVQLTTEQVLHKCDTPNCVEPRHLFLGTQKDNMQDKKLKGRAQKAKGEDSPISKLDNELVEYIYNQRGKISGKVLAKQLGLGNTIIYYIWEKRRWTHVTDAIDMLKKGNAHE